MKDLLFLAADLWLMATTWIFGFKMLRFHNHLLSLEWFVVAVSSTNFLAWSLLGGDESSPMYHLAYILDAFSRSFGFTLLLIVGLLTVTDGYKPPLRVKLGVVALTAVSAVILGPIHNDHLVHDGLHLTVASFYVVTNLVTTVFLAYFTMRVWKAGAHLVAVLTGLATAAGTYVAVTYDFFPFSFDDEYRTIFYTIALTVWGCQAATLYFAYRALHDHAAAVTVSPPTAGVAS
jgi:fluoride ion exporter CrcB/FEX